MSTKTYAELEGAEMIDSRDLIETMGELNEQPLSMFDEHEFRLLCAIHELAEEGIAEWEDGAQLIREDTFENYARELAEDIGAIDGNESWPLSCINWERAARELRQGYSTVEFLGYDYYVRS